MSNSTPRAIARRAVLAGTLAGGVVAPLAGVRAATRQGADVPIPSSDHRIVRVTAAALSVPIVYPYGGAAVKGREHCCHVEVETVSGLIGHGMTGIVPDMRNIADIVNKTIGPTITGEDAMRHEAIWSRLYWMLTPRGQSGFAVHAMSAVDIALWDIKGKALGLPIATLLGGAREKSPLYMTFGSHILDREQLVAAGKDLYRQGYKHLKIVVGRGALRNRDKRAVEAALQEDVDRVAAVRKALGDGAHLYVDANCNLDYPSAKWLIEKLEPYRLAFFEEPLKENDAALMAELKRATGVVLSAGQNEGRASRFRDLLLAKAIDYAQPNVMNSGGFTQAVKIAGMAESFNIPIANGGAAGAHNLHLHAGLAHGGKVEWHATFMEMCKSIYDGVPEPKDGWLAVPARAGLGFEPNRDAIAAFSREYELRK